MYWLEIGADTIMHVKLTSPVLICGEMGFKVFPPTGKLQLNGC